MPERVRVSTCRVAVAGATRPSRTPFQTPSRIPVNASTEPQTMPASASALELLRRFEPIVRYTQGEQFYPMDVETYIQESSLWQHAPSGRDTLLVPQGKLTLEKGINLAAIEKMASTKIRKNTKK